MFTLRASFASRKTLLAYWQVWALMLVAFARRVRALEDQQARGAVQQAEALEQFAAFALAHLLVDIVACEAQAPGAQRRDTTQLQVVAHSLMLIGYVARAIKARLLATGAFRMFDGVAWTIAAPLPISADPSAWLSRQQLAIPE